MQQETSRLDPVVKEVTVACPPESAFRVFTEKLGEWWPAHQYSISLERVSECGMETRQGGEIYELRDDGERYVWGTVQIWEPPKRVQFTWHPGRDPKTAQTVEVTFAEAEKGTRVRLNHRNWELLGERASEAREGYSGGWEHVFRKCYVDAANLLTDTVGEEG